MQKENTPKARAVARGQEPAYPAYMPHHPDNAIGFTKREVIAKDVLASMIANPSIRFTTSSDEINNDMRRLASNAAKMADALLIELSKGEHP